MNRRLTFTVVTCGVVLAVVFLVNWRTDPKKKHAPAKTSEAAASVAADALPSQSSLTQSTPVAPLNNKEKADVARIVTAFSAPITFYGRVVDDTGTPVANASVHYSAADRYFGDTSKYEGKSDSEGLFSISGIKGAGLFVSVYKDGYAGMAESGASFGYGVPSGRKPPTKQLPATFVLRKKAVAEPLIVLTSRQFEAPKDGTPVRIQLTTGRRVTSGDADLTVQTWVHDDSKDVNGRFEWRVRVSAPKGGIAVAQPDTFQAPADGYKVDDEINMLPPNQAWKRHFAKQYFVRVGDERFGRVSIEMTPGGRYNFFVLESFVNPSGSRNLEFDPAKQINAK